MTSSLYRHKKELENGFTLIELLVVMLIIGILSGIAVPYFLNQRKLAVDATVETDITNAGRLLGPEVLKRKTLTSIVTITEKGVLRATGEVDPFERVASTDSFDMSSIRVSPGTSLIIQPSPVDGGVCIFAVNPGGDIAAKSPGFVYDSLAGGLRRNNALSPKACANNVGELNIPKPEIDIALNPDKPSTPTTPPNTETTVFTETGKITDRAKACFVGKNYKLTITHLAGSLKWKLEGMESMNITDGDLTFVEYNNGKYVKSHTISFLSGVRYSGVVPTTSTGTITLEIEKEEYTVFWSGYKEYHFTDLDWNRKVITKNC